MTTVATQYDNISLIYNMTLVHCMQQNYNSLIYIMTTLIIFTI